MMIYPWQQQQWHQVEKLIAHGRVPHALLFTGSDGLGKSTFADAVARALLCQSPTADHTACGKCRSCLLMDAATHPDMYHIRPTPPANSKSANPVLSIKIDDIRNLTEKINQSSQFGRYRIAIIEDAECLTLSASNSLLKTLEEPGADVLIILVTAHPQRLPVTIRSRCQQIRFTAPEIEQGIIWLQQNDTGSHSQDELKQATRGACGSPLAALRYLDEIEHHQVLSEALTARISGRNSLDYSAKLANYARARTLEGMMSWALDLGKIHICGPEIAITNENHRLQLVKLASDISSQRLFRFQEQLNFNLSHTSITLNEQLLWENLLLSWDNL